MVLRLSLVWAKACTGRERRSERRALMLRSGPLFSTPTGANPRFYADWSQLTLDIASGSSAIIQKPDLPVPTNEWSILNSSFLLCCFGNNRASGRVGGPTQTREGIPRESSESSVKLDNPGVKRGADLAVAFSQITHTRGPCMLWYRTVASGFACAIRKKAPS